MSFISGTAGAILGAQSQDAAKKANLANAEATNATNLRMFQDSRGASGSAVLPNYLDSGTERLLAPNAASAAQARFPNDPQAQLAYYQAIVDQMRPTIQAGTDAISGIYNGQIAATLSARQMASKASSDAVLANATDKREIGVRPHFWSCCETVHFSAGLIGVDIRGFGGGIGICCGGYGDRCLDLRYGRILGGWNAIE